MKANENFKTCKKKTEDSLTNSIYCYSDPLPFCVFQCFTSVTKSNIETHEKLLKENIKKNFSTFPLIKLTCQDVQFI